jgi:hypothetical protein
LDHEKSSSLRHCSPDTRWGAGRRGILKEHLHHILLGGKVTTDCLFLDNRARLDRDTTDCGRIRRSRGGIPAEMTWIPRTCLAFMAAIIGSSSAFAPAHRVAIPSFSPEQCSRGNGMRMAFDSNHKSKQEGFDFASLRVDGLPAVVLVRPSLDRNIGACARNMLNFGLTDIRCEISSDLNMENRSLESAP